MVAISSLRNLTQLAAALTDELETIRAFDLHVGLPPVAEGVDFYAEVRRLEIFLIKQALKHTHGSQVKAASLLRLKPTTLNCMIQKYKILW